MNLLSEKKSTFYYILTSIGTKFILLFGGFVVSVILARLLGPEGKGLLTAIFVIPTLIISLADLGVRQATAFFVGKKLYSVNDITSSLSLLWLMTSTLAIGITYIFFNYVLVESYEPLLVTLVLVTIPLNLIIKYSVGIMQGREKINSINLASLLNLAINIIGVVILVWFFDLGVLGAIIVHVLFALGQAIYSILIVKKIALIKIKYIKPIPQRIFYKGILYALALFVLQLNYRIDIIFLERMASLTDVGLYSVGTNISELIWQIPAAIGMVLFAKSANSKKVADAVSRSVRLLRITLPLLLVVALLVGFFANYLIELLYGSQFIESASVIRLLLPGILLMVVFKILNADLAGRGNPLFALWIYLVSVVVNILLNFALIPGYGIAGAAIASTISYSIGAYIFALLYSKSEKLAFKDLFIMTKDDIQMIKSNVKRMISR